MDEPKVLIFDDESWQQLYDRCRTCTDCELHCTRTNCVFGTGNINADIMFVGEAPGQNEDLQGVPFVGRAGQLFDRYLYAVGIERSDVYIANILKCRPPQNRDPLPEEQDRCINYLREQVKLVKPKIIVCLGRIAAMRLIRKDYMITKEHGQWVQRGDFLMTAVYHPALLLRDPRKKGEMLVDMQMISDRLNSL